MARRPFADHSVRRLRILVALFFLTLAVPTGVLLRQSYDQLKWEAFHTQRLQAEELLRRIDERYGELIGRENARAFTDYSFLNVVGDSHANILQRSALSAFPVRSAIPGTLGYFQIDHTGRFSTPLLPEDQRQAAGHGVNDAELDRRRALRDEIHAVLKDNRLLAARTGAVAPRVGALGGSGEADRAGKDRASLDVEASSASSGGTSPEPVSPESPQPRVRAQAAAPPRSSAPQPVPAQSAFDELATRVPAEYPSNDKQRAPDLGRLADLKLERRYEARVAEEEQLQAGAAQDQRARPAQERARAPRKEQNVLLKEPVAGAATDSARVSMFESEVDAFEFSMLDSGHLVLYRKVWHDDQRYIQGLLIDADAFIDGVIRDAFYQSGVSQGSNLAVAYQGNVIRTLGSREGRYTLAGSEALQGTLLLQNHLAEPLSRMEVVLSVNRLPAGPGGRVLAWTALVLLIVFSGGFYLMYRVGLRQIWLVRQQQDFVSAVSHELKTPLTSIRMYGEILREGWASEERRKTYYDYIFHESERLTRLINNVLQLARMSRNDLQVELKPHSVAQLVDTIRSKVGSQVEHAGFALAIHCDESTAQHTIEVDADYFTQVIINLVDNALKFSAKAQDKRIDIGCQPVREGRLQISVRDYGSGIPRNQLRKIFHLFYRMDSELTRETAGTGIGLALVRELVHAMHGEIDVVNQSPGAEFRVVFPLH